MVVYAGRAVTFSLLADVWTVSALHCRDCADVSSLRVRRRSRYWVFLAHAWGLRTPGEDRGALYVVAEGEAVPEVCGRRRGGHMGSGGVWLGLSMSACRGVSVRSFPCLPGGVSRRWRWSGGLGGERSATVVETRASGAEVAKGQRRGQSQVPRIKWLVQGHAPSASACCPRLGRAARSSSQHPVGQDPP